MPGILQEAVQGTTLVEAAPSCGPRGPAIPSLADAVRGARLRAPRCAAGRGPCSSVPRRRRRGRALRSEGVDPEGRRGALAAIARRGASPSSAERSKSVDADGALGASLERSLDRLAPLLRRRRGTPPGGGGERRRSSAARSARRTLRAVDPARRHAADERGITRGGELRRRRRCASCRRCEAGTDRADPSRLGATAPRPELQAALPRGRRATLEVDAGRGVPRRKGRCGAPEQKLRLANDEIARSDKLLKDALQGRWGDGAPRACAPSRTRTGASSPLAARSRRSGAVRGCAGHLKRGRPREAGGGRCKDAEARIEGVGGRRRRLAAPRSRSRRDPP